MRCIIDDVINCNFVNIFIRFFFSIHDDGTIKLDALYSLIYNLFLVRVPCKMSVMLSSLLS
jgi:hypothetical protein